MIGLVVLAILVLYVIFVFNLASYFVRLAGFGGRPVIIWGVMTILLVLPFADEIVGRVQFDQACKKVAGYSVTDTIRSAQLAKYGDWPPPTAQLAGWIPITRRTGLVFSVPDGAVLMKHDSLSTPGGWVMRAGLNLGNFSSCNNVNTAQIMEQHGFELIEDGFFKRINGG